jgi:hypothetical protein
MRSHLGKTREAQGVIPAMGVKCEIEEIERTETGENSQTPGMLMYQATFRVLEPEMYVGSSLRDWFVIGTKDDKRAKQAGTWERAEGGPGRLARLLKRAGVPNADDDEEWMDAAAGQQICMHVSKRTDENGEPRNRVGMYFRESDADFIGIGEELERDGAGRGGRKKASSTGDGKARKAKAKDDDEGEEDEPKAKGKKAKDEDDEAEGDEDDEPPKKARGRKAKAADDEGDDDED